MRTEAAAATSDGSPSSDTAAPFGGPAPRRGSLETNGWKPLVHTLLAVTGVAIAIAIVQRAGGRAVWQVVRNAGVFLPGIILGEVVLFGMDLVAWQHLLGERASTVSWRTWLRGSAISYALTIFVPSGRSAGEIARAATLAPVVGAPRAAAAAIVVQGSFLFANGLVSIPCAFAAAYCAPHSILTWLVAANGLLAFALGAVFLFGMRTMRLGAWSAARFRALGAAGPAFDEAVRSMPRLPRVPLVAATVGRFAQTLQYAAILAAVGISSRVSTTFAGQGIHLVAAAFGDLVPNQVGVSEGAYRVFEGVLGAASTPDRAVAIAVLHRIAQVALAAVCACAVPLLASSRVRSARALTADPEVGT